MQYLTIRNQGRAALESFTMWGVSSSRGDSAKIGQFGSGAKHGILTCLRFGHNPIVYCGKTKVSFWTEPSQTETGTPYTAVLMQVGTKTPKKLDAALEFGAIDWKDISMGLREFVSNALDAVDGDPSKVAFKVVERIHPDDDATIVGVPISPEVNKFFLELGTRFLQFSPSYEATRRLLPKVGEPSPSKIYRKGVFVRSCGGDRPSLFDYNFDENVSIDESRNMDDYSAACGAMELACVDETALKAIFRTLSGGKEYWESTFAGNWRVKQAAQQNPAMWQSAFRATFGDKAVITMGGLVDVLSATSNKGYVPVVIQHGGWYDAMLAGGIPSALDIVKDDFNDKGNKLVDASPSALKTAKEIWDWLELLGVTKGKPLPYIGQFQTTMSGGSETLGYYKDGKVYGQVGQENNRQMWLEEFAHYITGSGDETRDLQDWAFRVSAAMMAL